MKTFDILYYMNLIYNHIEIESKKNHFTRHRCKVKSEALTKTNQKKKLFQTESNLHNHHGTIRIDSSSYHHFFDQCINKVAQLGTAGRSGLILSHNFIAIGLRRYNRPCWLRRPTSDVPDGISEANDAEGVTNSQSTFAEDCFQCRVPPIYILCTFP